MLYLKLSFDITKTCIGLIFVMLDLLLWANSRKQHWLISLSLDLAEHGNLKWCDPLQIKYLQLGTSLSKWPQSFGE